MTESKFIEWVKQLREKYQVYTALDVSYDAFIDYLNRDDGPPQVTYTLYLKDISSDVFENFGSLEKRVKELLNDNTI